MRLPNGIHQLTRETYDAQDRVNWSTLKLMGKSPAHYRARLLGAGDKDTAPRKRGRAVHLAALEPEVFARSVVRWDGGRRAGGKWEAFREANSAKEILTADEHAGCLAIQAAVLAHPGAGKYLKGGMGEASILWTHKADELGGVPGYSIECKGRVDFISRAGAIVDLKTTRDASAEGFARECWRYRYHTQAAFYVDGHFAATGELLPFVIVAVESEAPHVAQVFRVPEHVLQVGRDEYRSLLDRLALCRAEGRWDGYADDEVELELPRWASAFGDDEDVSELDLTFNDDSSAAAEA